MLGGSEAHWRLGGTVRAGEAALTPAWILRSPKWKAVKPDLLQKGRNLKQPPGAEVTCLVTRKETPEDNRGVLLSSFMCLILGS